MAPIFSKNAILVGMVDYFCLVCETHLKSEKDVGSHISKPVHQKQLELIQYVEELKAEGIKKIKNKYFCEFCNKLLTVLARVRLHITEQTHVDNKTVNILKRVGNHIIAFEKVAISDVSWNGLYENACAICSIEYDNEEIHKNQASHILNVIQIQVEFDSDKNIYRKIDEYSFHCLTCNSVLGFNSLTSHFNGNEHKTKYQACCDAYHKIPLNTQTEKTFQDELPNPETSKEEVTSAEPKFVQNDKINASKETTIEINNLNSADNTLKTKENYIKFEYNENDEENIFKSLNVKDYIMQDESYNFFCILCHYTVHSEPLASHINGKHHQILLKLHKKRLEKLKSNNIINNNNEHKIDTSNIASDEIFEKLDNFQRSGIQINFESRTAFCKKCNTHLEFVCEEIATHILKHKNETKPKNSAFKKENVKTSDLKMSDTNKTLFTSPVQLKHDDKKNTTESPKTNNSKVTSTKSLTVARELFSPKTTKPSVSLENLSSNNDKENIPKNAEIKEIKSCDVVQVSSPKPKKPKAINLLKVPSGTFVHNLVAAQHLMYKDIIVNDKYCVNFLAFIFLVQIGTDKFKCESCETFFTSSQFEKHIESPNHLETLSECMVIINDDSEFIREIRPGCFQCGFCNCVETSWDDVELHLKSSEHKTNKSAASWRLGVYRPRVDTGPSIKTLLTDRLFMDAFINKFL